MTFPQPKYASGFVLFDGPLSPEQVAEFRREWDHPSGKLRRLLIDDSVPPNRLHGAYINDDGDAV